MKKLFPIVLAFGLALGGLAACETDEGAVDEVGDEVEDAAEETEDAVD